MKKSYWKIIKMILLLIGGFIGLTLFDIGADGVELGEQNQFIMATGTLITLFCFAKYGILYAEKDEDG